MKKSLILIAALSLIGCQDAAQPPPAGSATTANANTNANAQTTPKPGDSAIVSSHSTESGNGAQQPPPPPPSNKSASTESPMAKPLDVSAMTADIEKAEKEFQKNPKAKADLAKAYFVRATALTGAAQYRAALGDYRKGLKLDPNDKEAKEMHDQILSIFKSIGREPPKEGEEPPPMPFGK